MNDPGPDPTQPTTAFVLGGGGGLGGFQAGMLRALFERGIKPDLIVGTSIGSLQGAIVAANPTLSSCIQLDEFWEDFVTMRVMRPRLRGFLSNARHVRAGLTTNDPVVGLITRHFGAGTRFEDLQVPFQCAATSIEDACVRYFERGPLQPALLASTTVPGLWPPVRIEGRHYLDGGLVDSLPVGRATSLGATTVYVLQLRQTDTALTVPTMPWQLVQVAFEASRRNQVLSELARTRPGVTVHVLPSGEDGVVRKAAAPWTSVRQELQDIRRRITVGYDSARAYLEATHSTVRA
ncbi:patatin-like phospholipase family protein [Kitasatospora sp. NBC_00070]|uniref:patatin-like phospholipase family protein n=1 Tax=Kitasatospora sp. NBC_00070 TaxID=2975962 RepID=UPI003245DC78